MRVDDQDVYHNLTQSAQKKKKQKWTWYLILCCLASSTASFQFGFNLACLNQLNSFLDIFYKQSYQTDKVNGDYFALAVIHDKIKIYIDERIKLGDYKGLNQTILNLDHIENFQFENLRYSYERFSLAMNESKHKTNLQYLSNFEYYQNFTNKKIEIDSRTKYLVYKITNGLFVIGGMFGAFTSKFVADFFGRKNGIVFHNFFPLIAAISVFFAPYLKSPICVMISRTLFAVQGGMLFGLLPAYLAEISPSALRGTTSLIHQLCLTFGIFVGQLLGFRQILGRVETWNILLAVPIIPALIGSICLLLFFTESPKALLVHKKNEEAARKSLQKLRNSHDVSSELDEIKIQVRDSSSQKTGISILQLFKTRELRWSLITGVLLQMTQQFSGINAIYLYSNLIFKENGIKENQIQYATVATGLINILATLLCVPLIERLGRKPLLVYPIFTIIVIFAILTFTLNSTFTGSSIISICLILLFIVCFAVGLGPIPFIYPAEVFNQESRSAGTAICSFTNWMSNLILISVFDTINNALKGYVFIPFGAFLLIAIIIIIIKVPETKGRTPEDIINNFNGNKYIKDNYSQEKCQIETRSL